jgi:hypothetical protein
MGKRVGKESGRGGSRRGGGEGEMGTPIVKRQRHSATLPTIPLNASDSLATLALYKYDFKFILKKIPVMLPADTVLATDLSSIEMS